MTKKKQKNYILSSIYMKLLAQNFPLYVKKDNPQRNGPCSFNSVHIFFRKAHHSHLLGQSGRELS